MRALSQVSHPLDNYSNDYINATPQPCILRDTGNARICVELKSPVVEGVSTVYD